MMSHRTPYRQHKVAPLTPYRQNKVAPLDQYEDFVKFNQGDSTSPLLDVSTPLPLDVGPTPLL